LSNQKEAAQRLISFIKDELGEHLATLLLGDYGSHQRRLSQTFLVIINDKGQELMLNVEVKTQDQWGLTCDQEPLVAIGLLKLLFARKKFLTGRASYSYQEVLNLLSWRDTKKSRDDIRDALDITFIQSFNLSADLHDPETPMSYLRRQHLMLGYEFLESTDDSNQWGERSSYRGDFLIDFNLNFIRGLREKSLLGINWNQVISIKRCHEVEGLSKEPD
jgi:hypothetical protein